MLQGSLIFLFGLRQGSFRFATALFINSERSRDKVGLGLVVSFTASETKDQGFENTGSYLTPEIKRNWKNN